MALSFDLVPYPRQLSASQGLYSFPAEGLIILDNCTPQNLRSSGMRVAEAIRSILGLNWLVHASSAVPKEQTSILLRVAPQRAAHVQSYRLHILEKQILVEGHDLAGVFYGVCTLIQVIKQFGREIPCLEILDWPDFPARGVMLDISRDKVYQMETLYELVDRLAGLKINQLQLYTEHTFAYQNHLEVWANASPMTGEQVLALDLFCKERFIELVPNQNSFGHMERWLKLARYADLAEIHGEFQVPWGTAHGPFSLAPGEPASYELVQGLYDELLPHFTSSMVNIGCDETFDVGCGKSKLLCEEKGSGRVYLDFLLKLYQDLVGRGKTVQFWGDIIVRHPELVAELPRDMIALEWGYESQHPFAVYGDIFAKSGIPFYVCPGTSAWCSLVGRTDNALGNLLNAAENGYKYGAVGYLITDWGDGGHWQPLPVSLTGFVAGAAYAWAVEANRGLDVRKAVSIFGFDDPSGEMGALAYELGNVYRLAGVEPENFSAIYQIYWLDLKELADQKGLQAENLRSVLSATDAALSHFENAHMQRPDAGLIRDEFQFAARLIKHGCRRGLFALKDPDAPARSELRAELSELLNEHKRLWLLRNRPGGLQDSCRRFETLLQEYSN